MKMTTHQPLKRKWTGTIDKRGNSIWHEWVKCILAFMRVSLFVCSSVAVLTTAESSVKIRPVTYRVLSGKFGRSANIG